MAWSDLPPNPNILLIITDQQRFPQHFPAGWGFKNLPSTQRILNHGLSFTNAFTAACECCPSRAAFLTSTYDNTNGIYNTGPNATLPTPSGLPSMGTILASAGHKGVWKGKWHVLRGGERNENSLLPWGFSEWDPPEAAVTMDLGLLGGGDKPVDGQENGNDRRYAKGAVDFLNSCSPDEPFFLVVSFANPHDVHAYALEWAAAGYPETIPDMGVALPDNHWDPLTDKPQVQRLFKQAFDTTEGGKFDLKKPKTAAGYVNFYAYLQTVVDKEIGKVLDALDAGGFTEKTLIVRMSDHGEMGMSHGLREKMYNAYDETIRVPLIFSNPRAFRNGPFETDAMASLLDLVPTLAAVAGATPPPTLRGQDLTPVLANPAASVQNGVLFSYDDNAFVSVTLFASNIRALRTQGWLYAVYFNRLNPAIPLEFELYNLEDDPVQMVNLLCPQNYNPSILPQWQSLNEELWSLADRLNSTPPGFTPPSSFGLNLELLEQGGKVAVREEDLVLDLTGK
jgi:arylsulfatase A-like enzyme